MVARGELMAIPAPDAGAAAAPPPPIGINPGCEEQKQPLTGSVKLKSDRSAKGKCLKGVCTQRALTHLELVQRPHECAGEKQGAQERSGDAHGSTALRRASGHHGRPLHSLSHSYSPQNKSGCFPEKFAQLITFDKFWFAPS